MDPIVLEDAVPRGANDGTAIVLALLAVAVAVAGAIIAGKFARIFSDLGLAVPPMTAWFLRPTSHALVAIVLAGLSVSSRYRAGSAAYAVVATSYVTLTGYAMFAPMNVLIESVGPA